MLDGDGGNCVWGKQMLADRSTRLGALPVGLTHHVRLKCDLAQGQVLRWDDVEYDSQDFAVLMRCQIEQAFV